MKIAIIGGSGLIGKNIARSFLEDEIFIFSRKKTLPAGLEKFSHIKLISSDKPNAKDLEGMDVIINLAGEPILGGRWSEVTKERIRSSRVDNTKQLVEELSKLQKKPSLLIQGSAIGYYGMYDSGKPLFTEKSEAGNDFLAKLCLDWEKEGLRAKEHGIPTAIIRIGIVLSSEGGALQQMLLPFKMFVGGPLGNGKQFMSWIHITDLVEAIRLIIQRKEEGVFNLTSPNPCSNKDFSLVLGKVLHRPAIFPVPSFSVSVLYGDGAEVVLKGQNVIPERLIAAKYQFHFSDLTKALENLLN